MKGESEKITKKYTNMHELSRHSIHMSETLQAASKTVEETLRDIETRLISPGSGLGLATTNTRNIVAGIRFSNVFLNNLKLRSDAFVARLENEIQMVRIYYYPQLEICFTNGTVCRHTTWSAFINSRSQTSLRG
jgi:hypothetical protein